MIHTKEEAALPLIDRSIRKLNPINVYTRAEAEKTNKLDVHFLESIIANKATNKIFQGKIVLKAKESFLKKRKAKKTFKVISAAELVELYVALDPKKNAYDITRETHLQDSALSKQERFFKRYSNMQNQFKRYLNKSCCSIGRQPSNSVLACGNIYREKIEKAKAIKPPCTEKDWYKNLRHSEKYAEEREYSLPLGSVNSGLWMKMLEEQGKPMIIIRTPFLSYGQRTRCKKVVELNCEIDKLMVVGISSYKMELNEVKNCLRQKEVEINEKEDNLDECI